MNGGKRLPNSLNHSPAGRSLNARFTLDGDSLVKCLQNAPSCAAMFFEYAKEFTMAVKKKLARRARLCWVGGGWTLESAMPSRPGGNRSYTGRPRQEAHSISPKRQNLPGHTPEKGTTHAQCLQFLCLYLCKACWSGLAAGLLSKCRARSLRNAAGRPRFTRICTRTWRPSWRTSISRILSRPSNTLSSLTQFSERRR